MQNKFYHRERSCFGSNCSLSTSAAVAPWRQLSVVLLHTLCYTSNSGPIPRPNLSAVKSAGLPVNIQIKTACLIEKTAAR